LTATFHHSAVFTQTRKSSKPSFSSSFFEVPAAQSYQPIYRLVNHFRMFREIPRHPGDAFLQKVRETLTLTP
jgi:hypothetical protein